MFTINHTPAGTRPYVNNMQNAPAKNLDFLEQLRCAEENAASSKQKSMQKHLVKKWEIDAAQQSREVEPSRTEMEQSQTDTDIVVKADGSRVLVITTSVGGMQTTMSLEISKPTAMQNDIQERSRHESGNICRVYDENQLYESENTEQTEQPGSWGVLC